MCHCGQKMDMFNIIFGLVLLATIERGSFKEISNGVDLLDGIMQVADVALDTAYSFPDVATTFNVPENKDLSRFEKLTKNRVIQELLHTLVEIWAQINSRFRQGLVALARLEEKAVKLINELKEHGFQQDLLNGELMDDLIKQRMKELMNSYKATLCDQGGIARSPIRVEHFEDLESRLQYGNMKSNLVALLPNYSSGNESEGLYGLLWTIDFISRTMQNIHAPLEQVKFSAKQQIVDLIRLSQALVELAILQFMETLKIWIEQQGNNYSSTGSNKNFGSICSMKIQ